MSARLARLVALVGALLTLAGLVLSARSVYLRTKAGLAGLLIRAAWLETRRSGRPMRPWPWADTHPVGRLVIPALSYDAIVLEGATPRTLAFGPARLMNGALPGRPGNLILAGHRTSWFRPLRDVAVGHEVVLEWRDGAGVRRRSYRVERIQVVEPGDASFLEPTAGDALTLLTCYPFDLSPRSALRLVVRAAPVGGTGALGPPG